TASNGTGSRVTAAIPKTTESTRWPAPKRTASARTTGSDLAESIRREDRRIDVPDHSVGRFTKQHRCRQLRRRRCGLDAEPALPGAPEESARARIEPIDGQPVGCERPQPRPAPFDSLDGPVDRAFEAIDRDRDVDFLRRRVARVGFDLVVRAEPDRPVAFALE